MIITRFAPGITGYHLHLGNLINAYINFLYAKKNKGIFFTKTCINFLDSEVRFRGNQSHDRMLRLSDAIEKGENIDPSLIQKEGDLEYLKNSRARYESNLQIIRWLFPTSDIVDMEKMGKFASYIVQHTIPDSAAEAYVDLMYGTNVLIRGRDLCPGTKFYQYNQCTDGVNDVLRRDHPISIYYHPLLLNKNYEKISKSAPQNKVLDEMTSFRFDQDASIVNFGKEKVFKLSLLAYVISLFEGTEITNWSDVICYTIDLEKISKQDDYIYQGKQSVFEIDEKVKSKLRNNSVAEDAYRSWAKI